VTPTKWVLTGSWSENSAFLCNSNFSQWGR
jgi:hypothetical protein